MERLLLNDSKANTSLCIKISTVTENKIFEGGRFFYFHSGSLSQPRGIPT